MNVNLGIPTVLAVLMAIAPAPFWAAQLPRQSDEKAMDALPSDDEIGDKITAAERQRDANLREYSVVRKYKLHNTHLKEDAVMTARLTFQKGFGKTFEVLDMENAEGMSRKVLEKLVASEEEVSRNPRQDALEISTANYNFHVTGTASDGARHWFIVDLKPKRKSKYLVQGTAWVDANDFGLIHIEGRPAANLSFWVGKPYIVQDFEKIGCYWVPAHNRSESQSMLLGASVLTIDYSKYQINPDFRVAENAHVPVPGKKVSIE